MPVLIALGICLGSHLSVDKSFPENIRNASQVVFFIVVVIYVIFGLIF